MTGRHVQVRWFAAAALVAALLALVFVPAGGASVHAGAPAAYSQSDCDALDNLSANTPDVNGSGAKIYGKAAAAAAVGYKTTAHDIDNRKLKASMLKIGSVYSALGRANNVASALAVTVRAGKGYVKALAVWGKATVECATASVTLPTNVTLPNGVTLPKIK